MSFGKQCCCNVPKNLSGTQEAETLLHNQDDTRSHTIRSHHTKKNCTTTPHKSQCRAKEDGAFRSNIKGQNAEREWCSGIVVVTKPNGKIRICVDLTRLNQIICREHYILPSVEQILALIRGAKIFSKLIANSEFWLVELAPEYFLLTTFITPFGSLCFKQMAFVITSAPEHLQ